MVEQQIRIVNEYKRKRLKNIFEEIINKEKKDGVRVIAENVGGGFGSGLRSWANVPAAVIAAKTCDAFILIVCYWMIGKSNNNSRIKKIFGQLFSAYFVQ